MLTRVSEHLSSWVFSSFGKSAFSDRLLISGHAYKGGSAKLIRRENLLKKRRALEEIEIICHRAMTNLSILNVFTPDHNLIAKECAVDVDDE